MFERDREGEKDIEMGQLEGEVDELRQTVLHGFLAVYLQEFVDTFSATFRQFVSHPSASK